MTKSHFPEHYVSVNVYDRSKSCVMRIIMEIGSRSFERLIFSLLSSINRGVQSVFVLFTHSFHFTHVCLYMLGMFPGEDLVFSVSVYSQHLTLEMNAC